MRYSVLLAATAISLSMASPSVAGTVPDTEPNETLATAQSLDGSFTLDADPDIESSTTIPHATVVNTASGGFDWFSFSVATANSLGIFDLDYGSSWDPFLDLFDSAGNRLMWSDDDTSLAGAGGSVSILDPYLQYTFGAAGTYYVRVGGCCDFLEDGAPPYDPFDDSVNLIGSGYTHSYELQVSLAAPGGVPEPGTWAMMLIGFGAVGFAMRRRPTRRQNRLAGGVCLSRLHEEGGIARAGEAR